MKNLYNKINGEELKQKMLASTEKRVTLSFYQYHNIVNPQLFRDHFYLNLNQIGVLGRIYVAKEGINAQISIPEQHFEAFKTLMNSIDFLKGIRLNIAIEDDGKSFFKLKIKVKEKIVADGLDDATFDPSKRGKHLKAAAYNKLVDQEDTIIIDMRNHYESEVGYFKGAIRPDVETFREALPLVEKMLEEEKDKHIVMYCTGGIRCEKASAYYLHKGFKNVYMVDGGIIEYAREVAQQNLENKYIGKNFVFDERMGERISEDVIAKCHQCGNSCDTHVNCLNDACHILFIQCESCATKHNNCCSSTCSDFNQLPEEKRAELKYTMQFNGTKFGKGRYKAHRKDQEL